MADSQWLTDTLNAIKSIFNSTTSDAATNKRVDDVVTRLTNDEAGDTEFKTAITALVTALQNSLPVTPGALPVRA